MTEGKARLDLHAQGFNTEGFTYGVDATTSGHWIEDEVGAFGAEYVPKC
jgi:hypothetical protein